MKLQCTAQHAPGTRQPSGGGSSSGSTEQGLTKFSVEIVQQLEFTTSAANSQPQQISTNVTVKAHTNASTKSDVGSPRSSNPPTPASSNLRPGSNVDIGKIVKSWRESQLVTKIYEVGVVAFFLTDIFTIVILVVVVFRSRVFLLIV